MTRLIPFAVAAVAVALTSACSTQPTTQSTPTIVTNVHPYKAGNGVVQSVFATPVFAAPATAGAGSSAERLQRLEIKMDSGTVQYVDTPSREFTRGMRVSLSEDRLIRRM